MKSRLVVLLAVSVSLMGCDRQDTPKAAAPPPPAASPDGAADNMVPSAGRDTFEHFCAPCHAAGNEHPGTLRLSMRLGDDLGPLLQRQDLTPEFVKIVVRNGLGLMPGFRPSEIDDEALEELARFLSKAERG